MLLSITSNRLDDAIIELLATSPPLSVIEMRSHKHLKDRKNCSQAVYQALNKLVAEGIVIKVGKRFTLSTIWVCNMNILVEKAFQRQVNGSAISLLASRHEMESAKRLTWDFTDLGKLNEFWNNVRIICMQGLSNHFLLSWHPTPLYLFVSLDLQLQFLQLAKKIGNQIYRIEGTKSVIDLDTSTAAARQDLHRKVGNAPFKSDKNKHLNVIGDIVIKASLDPATRAALRDYFAQFDDRKTISHSKVRSLMYRKIKGRLTLERNPAEAARYHNAFAQIFRNPKLRFAGHHS